MLWWQRVVSLSHLDQPLFHNRLLLQSPSGSFYLLPATNLETHPRHLPAPIESATLTTSLVGNTGSGCGVGAMSIRVADRASMAESAPPAGCVRTEKRHK